MMEFSEVQLSELIVHQIGNKLQEEGCVFSAAPLPLADENLGAVLLKYFLTPFKGSEFHHFHHDSDLALHELNTYCGKLFDNPDALVEQSVNMAQHLYNQSMHHKVKAGELYVCYLRNCVVDGELMDAIGLFKSETKDTFLQVNPSGDNFSVNADTGININKLDKGCLVFNTDRDSGFRIAIVDTANRDEARYWREDFLALKPRQDNYHHTQHYLNLCKSFATEQMPKDFVTVRANEIDLLNKSAKYFKEKDVFDLNEFSEEVLAQPDLVDSFKQFKGEYQKSHALEIKDEFSISEAAVKRGGKVFKSILKLDKNFHVYIHGNRDLIERGEDEVTGMKYYKLFFTKEE